MHVQVQIRNTQQVKADEDAQLHILMTSLLSRAPQLSLLTLLLIKIQIQINLPTPIVHSQSYKL